jgi:hypothetical protein
MKKIPDATLARHCREVRRLLQLGLAKESTIDGKLCTVATALAKRDLGMLLRRRASLGYWEGVLLSHALLSDEEWEGLELDLTVDT